MGNKKLTAQKQQYKFNNTGSDFFSLHNLEELYLRYGKIVSYNK